MWSLTLMLRSLRIKLSEILSRHSYCKVEAPTLPCFWVTAFTNLSVHAAHLASRVETIPHHTFTAEGWKSVWRRNNHSWVWDHNGDKNKTLLSRVLTSCLSHGELSLPRMQFFKFYPVNYQQTDETSTFLSIYITDIKLVIYVMIVMLKVGHSTELKVFYCSENFMWWAPVLW